MSDISIVFPAEFGGEIHQLQEKCQEVNLVTFSIKMVLNLGLELLNFFPDGGAESLPAPPLVPPPVPPLQD